MCHSDNKNMPRQSLILLPFSSPRIGSKRRAVVITKRINRQATSQPIRTTTTSWIATFICKFSLWIYVSFAILDTVVPHPSHAGGGGTLPLDHIQSPCKLFAITISSLVIPLSLPSRLSISLLGHKSPHLTQSRCWGQRHTRHREISSSWR